MRPRTAATISVVALVAVLTITSAGCTVGGGASEYRDPAVPIVVEKGEEFSIVLESNPSSGYRWRLGKELDEKVITLQKVEFEEPKAGAAGQAGEERWTFKAAGLGRAEVVLEHVHPWEKLPIEGTPKDAMEERSSSEKPEGVMPDETGAAAASERRGASGSETKVFSEPAETEEAAVFEERSTLTSVEAGEVTEEGRPETLVFSVWVKEKGTRDKKPGEYKDPSETVEVKEGYRFSVVLEADPTAGLHWELAKPLDEELLALVSVTFEVKGGGRGEGEKGAPGEETWTFEALRPGETNVSFILRGDEEPGKSMVFKVKIKGVEGEESSTH